MLRVAPGQWFVDARIEADAAAVRDLYLRQGFGRVAVAAKQRTGSG